MFDFSISSITSQFILHSIEMSGKFRIKLQSSFPYASWFPKKVSRTQLTIPMLINAYHYSDFDPTFTRSLVWAMNFRIFVQNFDPLSNKSSSFSSFSELYLPLQNGSLYEKQIHYYQLRKFILSSHENQKTCSQFYHKKYFW